MLERTSILIASSRERSLMRVQPWHRQESSAAQSTHAPLKTPRKSRQKCPSGLQRSQLRNFDKKAERSSKYGTLSYPVALRMAVLWEERRGALSSASIMACGRRRNQSAALSAWLDHLHHAPWNGIAAYEHAHIYIALPPTDTALQFTANQFEL
jgi:hypothetical protein